MQQFALASVYPRSIAWLIRLDEWERFVKIINYNCAMVGGYFNVLIPLADGDTVADAYQRFLIDYDPDLIVLAPGMTPDQLDYISPRLHPFGIIPWEAVGQFVSIDPLSRGGGQNITTVWEYDEMFKEQNKFSVYVAVADEQKPDTSRLALVACGDIVPREPMLHVMDENVDLDATGYREHFLEKLISHGVDRKYIGAFLGEEDVVPAPDLYQLKDIIFEEHQFPLSDAAKILEVCCRLQHFPSMRRSFVDLTVTYCTTGGTPQRIANPIDQRTPGIVILVSDQFGLEESLLIWNLRANAIYVAWLSFLMLEKDAEAIVRWLESDYGGIFYSMMSGLIITFASAHDDLARLQIIVDSMQKHRSKTYPFWEIVPRESLILYNYVRPAIAQERVTVIDELPEEVLRLLEHDLLERGFVLGCHACSFKSWYPAGRVGQTFECARCFQTQVYTSNPLWVYKLSEVIFQGFENNMQVPLFVLDYMKKQSRHFFEWIPDSNLYVRADDKKHLGNIDVLCLCDGKFYIGEAKSNDEIKADQFAFYERICRSVAVDGVIFATTEPYWNRGTLQRIEQLKSWFVGEVLILTEKELYADG